MNTTDLLLEHCRSLPGTTEDVKWGDNLVFSVGLKMYGVFDLPECQSLSFKVDPMVFASLAEQEAFEPAPYLARHHWVKVADRSQVPADALEEFFSESYHLVAARLPKKTRLALGLA